MAVRRFGLALVVVAVSAGCLSDHANRDPIEPVMMAITNNNDHSIFLDMTPGGDILGSGVRLQHKGSADYLQPVPSCEQRLCSDPCEVTACAHAPSVREILPKQTYSFTWMPYEFAAGRDVCTGQTCVAPAKAPDGRYLMSACYGTDLAANGVTQKSAADPLVIEGAAVTTATCTATFDIGLPGYEVRYQLYIP